MHTFREKQAIAKCHVILQQFATVMLAFPSVRRLLGIFKSIKLFVSYIGTTSSAYEKNATPKDGMSRTASGSDINEKTYSLFFQLEKLAKVTVFVRLNQCQSLKIHKFLFIRGFLFPAHRFYNRKRTRNAVLMELLRIFLWLVAVYCRQISETAAFS